MHSQPGITVVVPVHNRAEIVKRTLRSIHSQTWRPLQVILVDNNSTDGTLATLHEWQRQTDSPDFRVTVLTEPVPGAAAARNRGLEHVTTEYTMFFDSDDIMTPGHVERAMKAFRSAGNPDIVGWNIRITDLHGKTFIKPFYATDTLWHCIMHGLMGTLRYAARTSLFRRAGAWNPAIKGWDDIELGIRMLKLNPKIIKVNGKMTVEVMQQEVSITGRDFSSTPWKWETSLDAIERTLADSKRHRRYVRLRRALLAGDYAREGNKTESDRLLEAAVAEEPCPFYRTLLRAARLYAGAGGRGGARLLRIFF